MCLQEEMPENSIALSGPEKEEQTPSIPAFPQGYGVVQKSDPAWGVPSGRAAEHFLAGGIGKNKATSLPSLEKQIPAVVHYMQKCLRSCPQSNTGPR